MLHKRIEGILMQDSSPCQRLLPARPQVPTTLSQPPAFCDQPFWARTHAVVSPVIKAQRRKQSSGTLMHNRLRECSPRHCVLRLRQAINGTRAESSGLAVIIMELSNRLISREAKLPSCIPFQPLRPGAAIRSLAAACRLYEVEQNQPQCNGMLYARRLRIVGPRAR